MDDEGTVQWFAGGDIFLANNEDGFSSHFTRHRAKLNLMNIYHHLPYEEIKRLHELICELEVMLIACATCLPSSTPSSSAAFGISTSMVRDGPAALIGAIHLAQRLRIRVADML